MLRTKFLFWGALRVCSAGYRGRKRLKDDFYGMRSITEFSFNSCV